MKFHSFSHLFGKSGISLKTQELYVVVFVARYMDLFRNTVCLYNTVMKLVLVGSSVSIVWCMRLHHIVRKSYDRDLDRFPHYFLIAGSLAMAFLYHEGFLFQEVNFALSLSLSLEYFSFLLF